ncbi:uncharacterized protein [Parasteatoda tepidariorum]|uniref:uncharacterized protein isoform X2 n=1 Tax=Parasteatoda tepidariorum TaxID=114398 RepID=UPI001C72224A|nr:uncharacterized protein LOC107454714 isoform X2 [Parasteatoda tepidariorum]
MARMMMAEKTTQDWKQVFPDFTTIEGSCLFIKKLIAVSLSSITYVRGIFPEKAYGNKDLSGVKLKILNEDCGLKSVQKFINLVRNCYDAVEKKYIVPDPQNREEILELYTLVFRYKDDENSVTCNGKNQMSSKTIDPVKQATLLMLKNAVSLSDMLEPLPKDAYLTVKLLYYDDVTPPDYEPVGFGPCQNEKFGFVGETMKIQVGKIDTDAHGFKFYLKTALGQSMSQNCDQNSMLNTSQSSHLNTAENEEPVNAPKLMQCGKTSTAEKESMLECPCKSKTDNTSNTITCLSCGRKQHTVCYAILNLEDPPNIFYCADCMLDNTNDDSSLDLVYTLPKEEREDFCIMRRALVFCTLCKVITCSSLQKKIHFSKPVATKTIERLLSEGFIKKSGRNKYTVDEYSIRNFGFEKYFPDKDKENVDTEVLHNDYSQTEFDDVVNDCGNGSDEITSIYDTEEYSQTDVIENSINQVQAMNLGNDFVSEKPIRLSQERKPFSEQAMSMANDLNEEKFHRFSQEHKTSLVRSSVANRSSQKRKLSTSESLLTPDKSEELFQSSASYRVKRVRKAKRFIE